MDRSVFARFDSEEKASVPHFDGENIDVIVLDIIVITTEFRIVDLAVSGAIGAYIIKEAIEILRPAKKRTLL